MARAAVFEGLIIDEADNAVEVRHIGGTAYYIVDDAGFLRHISSEEVDRQVLTMMQESVLENRGAVVEGMLQYLGKDDLFTKAAVEASLGKMHENIETLMQVGLPEEARTWMGLMGMRVMINIHGEVTNVEMPGSIDFDD